ncbi:hypothetical protein BFJ69_g15546 [Fusarium oxysporum]|uniref:Uncharacterized protein n=1 Tax=Fusarium oxysporum TaxID=5507 RepID=A0A420MDZ8_FUSOX|nr:hypothetical protein BFJ69_g15546 [Fusarium oxysporum]
MDASARNQVMEGFTSYHLQDLTFTGPSGHKRPAYASIAILDPIITIERRHGKYHIAARFNIETAILDYASQHSDGRELFFHDICLQYKSPWDNETLSMKPESDPAAALTVTRGFTSSTSATAGVTASQTPSGNVSLGLTKSRSLTVEYAMTSWSLSAHRVVNDDEIGSGDTVHYQWFWAGTQDESGRLSSDLRHAVKRHVVVKRIVSEEMVFPLVEKYKQAVGDRAKLGTEQSRHEDVDEEEGSDDGGEDGGTEATQPEEHTADPDPASTSGSNLPGSQGGPETEPKPSPIYTWESLLEFNFSVQVRCPTLPETSSNEPRLRKGPSQKAPKSLSEVCLAYQQRSQGAVPPSGVYGKVRIQGRAVEEDDSKQGYGGYLGPAQLYKAGGLSLTSTLI